MREKSAARPTAPNEQSTPRREVALLFLRLGCTAFGGPAAHIAMMRDEVVRRRGWVSDERFMDLLGVANLIPGPTSTELAIYLGYVRAGWTGLVLAGVCFIAPAMAIVLGLAWAYHAYGALPQARWVFAGVQPVVVAIVAHALWNLRRTVLRTPWSVALVAAVMLAYLLGANVLALLLAGAALSGGASALVRWRAARRTGATPLAWLALGQHWPPWRLVLARPPLALLATAVPFTYATLFLTFLKIGAIVYGSGYVLLAYLRADLVQGLHWLTERQLLDAVAVGQFTPGPVFTTATFIGFLVGGWQGALVATLAIFLPSFALIAATRPVAGRLRRSPWTAPVLDGLNAASLALMAGVLAQLGQVALSDAISWLVALAALALLLRTCVNPAWLIAAGALIGLARFGLY
jgi:chromate transporter